MKSRGFLFPPTALAVIALLTCMVGTSIPEPLGASPPEAAPYGNLPLVFEPNQGQVPGRAGAAVDFVARGPGYNLALTRWGALLSLRRDARAGGEMDRRNAAASGWEAAPRKMGRVALQMRLLEAAAESSVHAEDPLRTKVNYFLGNRPRAWRTEIETFGKVRYREVYRGVDVVYYGKQRHLEYDFVVAPGADPNVIRFRFEGADDVRVEERGSLRIEAGGASLTLEPPTIYQETEGGRTLVAGRYEVGAGRQIHFQLGDYDREKTLTIDPVLVYSTFLGGSGDPDRPRGVAVDSGGNAYITGFTESLDFPTASPNPGGPVQDSFGGGAEDVFVTKLNPEGSEIIYSTYVGGTETFRERGNEITVDSSGNAYVACSTNAPDFPTGSSNPAGPLQAAATAGGDACIFKLSADGSTLLYSTYLGGNGGDTSDGLDVDASGNAYVSGFTGSTDLPDTSPNPSGAFQTVRQGPSDGYVAKLNADGSALIYLTYLGGTGGEGAADVHLDSDGSLFVAGQTSSADFPVTSPSPAVPFQSTPGSAFRDAYVAKLKDDASDLIYATYLGGDGDDVATALDVDAAGNAYVTGITQSTDFPTASPNVSGPFQTAAGGGQDGFVAKVNADGSGLLYSTYLGTAVRDVPDDIVVDSLGNAHVTGDTASPAFPTQDATQPAYGGGSRDAFVARLDPDGASLLFSTFLGGNDFDAAEGLALDAAGNIYVTGLTRSGNFPTLSPDPAGPFQTAILGNTLTGFVTKIRPFDDEEGPEVTGVVASPNPVEVNGPAGGVTVTATADDTNTGGSTIASAEYSIDGGVFAPMSAVDSAFDEVSEDVTAQIGPFAASGVLEVCVRATDAAGNVGEDEEDCVLLPVYDPDGGFVTGGGSIESPAGADLENGATGPARFGFVSKYLPGQNTPDGNLEFRFKAGDIRFHSTNMDWLVVTGEPRAIFRGDGELNGQTECKFEVDAWDGSFSGPGVQNEDAFGLKIFACGPGVDRYALDATPLSNGNIKIHN